MLNIQKLKPNPETLFLRIFDMMNIKRITFLIILFSGLYLRVFAGDGDSCAHYSPPKTTINQPDSVKFMMLRLPDNSTPKQAVFCRFENTMTRTFHVDIRLRVEQPEKN